MFILIWRYVCTGIQYGFVRRGSQSLHPSKFSQIYNKCCVNKFERNHIVPIMSSPIHPTPITEPASSKEFATMAHAVRASSTSPSIPTTTAVPDKSPVHPVSTVPVEASSSDEPADAASLGLSLELGDVIEITAPTNADLHERIYYITYVDGSKIRLIDLSTYLIQTLHIDEENHLTDESITQLSLMSRSEEKGYARQNQLLPSTWIDIHFGGEIPAILTGEITNLEEDMIEVTTFPELKVIYINFDYKGIPEDIPIEKIAIREKPISLKKGESLVQMNSPSLDDVNLEEATIQTTETGEIMYRIPEGTPVQDNVRELLHTMYLEADDIVFEELGEIVQVVEVAEHEKRFSVEAQIADFTDKLVNAIPLSERNDTEMEKIGRLLAKFKQLRHRFSVFDDNQNVAGYRTVGGLYKPLVDKLARFNQRVKWLVPVVKMRKKIYQTGIDDEFDASHPLSQTYPDVDFYGVARSIMDHVDAANRLTWQTTGESNRYEQLQREETAYMTPFTTPDETTDAVNNETDRSIVQAREADAVLETIVSNLGDLYSSVAGSIGVQKRRAVIQRYGLGATRMVPDISKSGRKVYLRKKIVPNDVITVQSMLMLPKSVVLYSRVDAPTTNILTRTSLAQQGLYMYRLLKEKTAVAQRTVDSLDRELDYEGVTTGKPELFLTNSVKEYVLDSSVDIHEDTFRGMMYSIIPKTAMLIQSLQSNMNDELSLVEMLQYLAPFDVFDCDLTWKQYEALSDTIRESLKKHKITLSERAKEFAVLRSTEYPGNADATLNRIAQMLKENAAMHDWMLEVYRITEFRPAVSPNVSVEDIQHSSPIQPETIEGQRARSPGESLWQIIQKDGGQLYSKMIHYLLLSLLTPDKIMDALQPARIDDAAEQDARKAGQCARREMAKKYSSLDDLKKDNAKEADDTTVVWDQALDKTPYPILAKYADEQAKVAPEDFLEFLTETLIEKHQIPANEAGDMAGDMIRGNRLVRDGEYAMLEIRPRLPDSAKEADLSEQARSELETEAEMRRKIFYYKRVNGNWVRDDAIEDEAFLDDDALLCNIDRSCYATAKKCETGEEMAERMINITREKMMKEFDTRWNMSMEDTQKQLESEIVRLKRSVVRRQNLREIQLQRPNMVAYQLGKYAEGRSTALVESPHAALRDLILAQDDFVAKQKHILRFVDTYTREPMLDKSTESPHWAYCIDTNLPLFPYSLYRLAKAFVYDNRYEEVLDQLCAEIGDQEGHAIVDKHSGYVLKTLDYAVEEEYDEDGFKVVSRAVMEQQASLILADILSKKTVDDEVKEDETTQMLTNIYVSLSQHVGIRKDAADDDIKSFVVRVASELVNDTAVVMTEAEYKKKSEKNEKHKGKPLPFTYRDFRHQTVLMIVGSTLLVAIQGLIPGFRTRKTFPGCVRSFDGYPFEGGEESTGGLEYVACIMMSMRAAIAPWDSLKKLNAAKLVDGMKRVLDKYVLVRDDVIAKRARKQAYLLENPVQAVPAEIDVSKWRTFLPPLVEYSLGKTLHGISPAFEKELLDTMRKGHRDQSQQIGVLYSKLILHGYAIFEAIRSIVQEKDLLMKTASNVPFRENACCNDGTKKTNALAYFAGENEQIGVYVGRAIKMEELLRNTRDLARAAILYHSATTGIRYVSELPPKTSLFDTEKHIYGAFIHYCNFDNDLPIPDDLVSVCNSKPPAGYDRQGTMEEKIHFLKSHGKRYMREEAIRLMMLVNRRNAVAVPEAREVSAINRLKDALEHLELSASTVIEKPIREAVWKVLDDYSPGRMVHEERPSVRTLYRKLRDSTDAMYTEIMHELNDRGRLSDKEYNELRTFLWEIEVWSPYKAGQDPDMDMVYKIVQFVKNSVHTMATIYPQMILTRAGKTVPKHWDVAPSHKEWLMEKTRDVGEWLRPFYKNTVFERLFAKSAVRMKELILLMTHLPVFAPIVKEDQSFYSLFDVKTTLMFAKYIWYSVFHEYFVLATDPELVGYEKIERRVDRMERRQRASDPSDLLASLLGETASRQWTDTRLDDAMDPEVEDMMVVEFQPADSTQLREDVAKMMVAFMRLEQREKQAVNKSYGDIQKKRRRMKDTEKKGFTDFLGKMSKEERALESTFRQFKLGRWNVGMQKGMFQYDKATFEKEMKNDILNAALATDEEIVLLNAPEMEGNEDVAVDAEELDAMEEAAYADDYNVDESGYDYVVDDPDQ